MVDESDKKYYDSIINLFIKGDTNSYGNEIREIEKDNPNKGKVDPKLLMNTLPLIQNIGDNIRKDAKNP